MIGVVLFAALLLVASPGGMVFLVWAAWRRHRRIRATIPLLSCDQIERAEVLPRWVAVAGRTASGGPHPLRAPRSGAECAWYQIEYARSQDGDDHLDRWVELPPAAELVAVTDGSGTVFLTPELARTTMTGPSLATVSAAGHEGGRAWQEVIIAADVPVFAIGRPARARDVGPLRTVIVEKGPWILPRAGFPMGTGIRPSPEQDGVVLQTGWLSPHGVTTREAADVRRALAVRLRWMIVLLFGLPALGVGLVLLVSASQR